jgi:hypothetical protein
VNVAYNDFDWIARRHGIENRKKEFKMATEVIESVIHPFANEIQEFGWDDSPKLHHRSPMPIDLPAHLALEGFSQLHRVPSSRCPIPIAIPNCFDDPV